MKNIRPFRSKLLIGPLLLGLVGAANVTEVRADPLPLKLAQPDIPLPGPAKRFDYESIDPERGLLFMAHLGAGTVAVYDLKTNKVVANIEDTPRVHGVLAVPSLGETFASATGANTLVVISEKTLKIVAKAPAGIYPDGIAYDPDDHELFISDEHGATETVINTDTNRRIATIPLGGEAGNSQYDPVRHLVFVDVQTADEIVAIDPVKRAVVQHYKLPETCQNDHGLLLDPTANLAFAACDENASLLTLTMPDMRTIAVDRVGDSPDVLAFDNDLQRLYVASESGVVSVFHLENKKLVPIARNFLAPAAHAVAVDQTTHKVYFPLENIGGIGVLRVMEPDEN
jgi:DNA-binding beta-propeller fold protein YncE